ncbi:Tom37 C-terminal domain-containing protein [Amylocarpus encephaloides]|uniref:Tom37 C-terminal domain-containing protein n=1 Tax=Amylocarpus encephaloides TaxID=45428 RepID=A0A9P7YR03_9HELO|nr:Tom37 C-terminal domain-containing protein [Amylocarpus encephaloides]
MVLELHVWGPAFSLASVDPHCLAAIAYLQQAVPRKEWVLVATSDPALSPTNELPALRNGDIWIGGFRNIFHYLAQYSSGEWVLDAGLPEQEGADCIAFSSFVESHGQPLIDLSLYVSSRNYSTTTRPLYNKIQPFPLPYLTPPSVRVAAKERTAHLGLSSLDIDNDETQSQEASIIPESLRKPKSTVSSLLKGSPETGAQIRLHALATDFFGPLNRLKGKKQYLVSDAQFSSLDCLALGYLSLCLIPDLPQPWLSQTLRRDFPDLCAWTEKLGDLVFGGAVHVNDAFPKSNQAPKSNTDQFLPWIEPYNEGALGVGGVFLSSIADSVPVVGQLRRNTRMRQHGGKTPGEELHGSSWLSLTAIGSLVAGVGLFLGYMFHQGLISPPERETAEKRRNDTDVNDFEDAGSILGIYSDPTPTSGRVHGAPEARVDVDIKPGEARITDRVS